MAQNRDEVTSQNRGCMGVGVVTNTNNMLAIVTSERYRWVEHGANGGEVPVVVLLIPQPLSCQSIMWRGAWHK